jgi:hypothetical protein
MNLGTSADSLPSFPAYTTRSSGEEPHNILVFVNHLYMHRLGACVLYYFKKVLNKHLKHKQENSVHPGVNWKDSTAYKLAKYLNTIPNTTLQLPNAFNVQNSSIIAHSLKQVKIDKNTRLCSFDIEYIFTNISIQKVKSIGKNIIENNNTSKEAKKEILDLLNVILEQNYIQHSRQWYKQDNGLAM